MFCEINKSLLKKNEDGSEPNKQWFRDADRECDLFVWQDADQKIFRFQFWFHDSLLEWQRGKGMRTGKMDKESGAFQNLQAPVFQYHLNFDQDVLKNIRQLLQSGNSNDDADKVFEVIIDELEGLGK